MTRRISAAVTVAAVMALGTAHTALATSYFPDTQSMAAEAASDFQPVLFVSLYSELPSVAASAARNAQRERAVFGPDLSNPDARTFSDVDASPATGLDEQPALNDIMNDLSIMVLASAVMAPDAAQLNMSTSYGAPGMFSTSSNISQLAMTLPGFDIGSTAPAWDARGPSPATEVPEPATGLLLLAGAAGLFAARRR